MARPSRLNALRHGILASAATTAGEHPAAWKRHLDATIDALQAVGHVELLLAERIALCFWRLGRVTRYEVAALNGEARALPLTANSGSKGSGNAPADDQASNLAAAALLAQQIHDGRDITEPPAEVLATYLWALLAVCPSLQDGLDVAAISLPAMRSLLLAAARELGGIEPVHAAVLRELQPAGRQVAEPGDGLLPDHTTAALITRYEAHIERSLARALSALSALQAERARRVTIVEEAE